MNLFEVNERVKTCFTIPTINTVLTNSVTILNEEQTNYNVAIADLANANLVDDVMEVTYTIFLLDRMQTNTQSPIEIWSWSLDALLGAKKNLEVEFDEYEIGEISFIEQSNDDVLAGCRFDLTLRYPVVIDC